MLGRFLRSRLGLAATAVLCLVSAIGVVSETYQTRLLFARLQSLESERWRLQENYSRLVIEYSTLSAPHRVSALSTSTLSMVSPDASTMKVVVE